MRRIAAGEYQQDVDADRWFTIVRGWADEPGLDRRRQTWVLSLVTMEKYGPVADILSDHPTLRGAKDEMWRRAEELAK